MKRLLLTSMVALALAACGRGEKEDEDPTPIPPGENRLQGEWTMNFGEWCPSGTMSLLALESTVNSESAAGTWNCGTGKVGNVSATIAECDAVTFAFSSPPATSFNVSGAIKADRTVTGQLTGSIVTGAVPFSALPKAIAAVQAAALAEKPCE